MKDVTERILNLPPEKRALLLRKLKVNQPEGRTAPERVPTRTRTVSVGERENFQVCFKTPGNLESLRFCSTAIVPPPPGMIQLRVAAISLNFRDLMIALGLYPTLPGTPAIMGSDCVGEVVAVGEKIRSYHIGGEEFFFDDAVEFRPGDEVVAITGKYLCPDSHFSPYINVFPFELQRRPARLTDPEAAGLPTAYLTAYYSLHTRAQLSEGERVLIHSAAGGVGLAAVNVAQWCGAEVYATASTPEKREYLRSLGVRHTMDSRSLQFADTIMELTNGKGVDVILNSLPGEAIPKGLSLLRQFGRFIEIGKRDVYQNAQIGLGPFRNGLTFTAVDIGLFLGRPNLLAKIYAEVMARVEDQSLRPLPAEVFPISGVGRALAKMSEAGHIGKLVVNLKGQKVLVTSDVLSA